MALKVKILSDYRGTHKDAHKLQDIILTSFFTSVKDQQRNVHMPAIIDYMYNFYISAKYHNLNVLIFHDNLTNHFVQNYTTNHVKFNKVEPWNDTMSTNDKRFVLYYDRVLKHQPKKVLLLDIADIIFWGNPFEYLNTSSEDNIFLSPDYANLLSNNWMKDNFRRCYGEQYKDLDHKTYCAGAWGGTYKSVMCLLKCLVLELTESPMNKYNCDQIAYNWCIVNSGCVIKDTNEQIINPFREQYPIIHDKCSSSKGKCMEVEKGKLVRNECRVKRGQYLRSV